MPPSAAAILWTITLLLWLRPGIIGGILAAIVIFEVFFLLSDLPIAWFERWPLLRPSSTPMMILVATLLATNIIQRLRRV